MGSCSLAKPRLTTGFLIAEPLFSFCYHINAHIRTQNLRHNQTNDLFHTRST